MNINGYDDIEHTFNIKAINLSVNMVCQCVLCKCVWLRACVYMQCVCSIWAMHVSFSFFLLFLHPTVYVTHAVQYYVRARTVALRKIPHNSSNVHRFFLFLLFLPMRLLACLRSHTCLHCWFFAVCCRSVLPPICIDRHCCCHCLFSIFLLLLFFPCTFLGMHIINRMYVCGTCVCTHVLCLRLPSDTLYQTHLSVLWAMEIGTLAAS